MEINLENAKHLNIQDARDVWEIIQRIFYQKKGESIQKVMKYTGLSKQWVGRMKSEVENLKHKIL